MCGFPSTVLAIGTPGTADEVSDRRAGSWPGRVHGHGEVNRPSRLVSSTTPPVSPTLRTACTERLAGSSLVENTTRPAATAPSTCPDRRRSGCCRILAKVGQSEPWTTMSVVRCSTTQDLADGHTLTRGEWVPSMNEPNVTVACQVPSLRSPAGDGRGYGSEGRRRWCRRAPGVAATARHHSPPKGERRIGGVHPGHVNGDGAGVRSVTVTEAAAAFGAVRTSPAVTAVTTAATMGVNQRTETLTQPG